MDDGERTTPEISVLTPCLNAADFVGDAICSVAGQGVRLEHILQDGGSTDGTVEILESASGVDWRSESDAGQSQALNRALARSSGEWIAWLNADEFYLPDGLQALIESATSEGADVVYGAIAHVDEAGRFRGLGVQHRFSRSVLSHPPTFIASCGVLIRRSVLPERPWDESLRVAMDWDLYLSLMASGARFFYVPTPIAAFRSHGGQITADPARAAAEIPRVIAKQGLPRSRTRSLTSRATHEWLRLADGRVRRARSTRSLRNESLRWWDEVGESRARDLIETCNKEGLSTPGA